jgi:DNA-binding response OmpR family regulator
MGEFTMEDHLKSPLKDKMVLVVDDEPDILATIEEELDMCVVHKAADYATAIQYLVSYTYDIVILDIMGVNGFELLKTSVGHGFPTVMLTAHALSPESMKKSIKLGAVSFLPKEKLSSLQAFLDEVVLGRGKASWKRLFDSLEEYFRKRFGPDWLEKDAYLKAFEQSVRAEHDPR